MIKIIPAELLSLSVIRELCALRKDSKTQLGSSASVIDDFLKDHDIDLRTYRNPPRVSGDYGITRLSDLDRTNEYNSSRCTAWYNYLLQAAPIPDRHDVLVVPFIRGGAELMVILDPWLPPVPTDPVTA